MVKYLAKGALTSALSDPIEAINNVIGASGIGLKILGEEIGLFDKNTFTNVDKKELDP